MNITIGVLIMNKVYVVCALAGGVFQTTNLELAKTVAKMFVERGYGISINWVSND